MRRLALAAAAIVLLVLGWRSSCCPGVAERRVRDDLEDAGATVEAVDVSAFPAVQLLWGRADGCACGCRGARLAGSGDLADELDRTRATDELDATVDQAGARPAGPARPAAAQARRAAARRGAVTRADLAAASPVTSTSSRSRPRDGVLVLQARAGPLTVRARLSADDGRLVVAPDGLLGGFASLTVFEDPRVVVEGVGARSRADGFTLTAEGRLS